MHVVSVTRQHIPNIFVPQKRTTSGHVNIASVKESSLFRLLPGWLRPKKCNFYSYSARHTNCHLTADFGAVGESQVCLAQQHVSPGQLLPRQPPIATGMHGTYVMWVLHNCNSHPHRPLLLRNQTPNRVHSDPPQKCGRSNLSNHSRQIL
jgi:hypothetical protein